MQQMQESSATALLDVALSRREERIVPQLHPDIAVTILALDRQGLPATTRPPRVSLLEASLACKEPPPKGADERALEPFTPGEFGEVPCPIVL